MQIQVQVKGLPAATKLRQLAADRLSRVLARFADAIDEVLVRLSDINGPDRGGADKLCRVVLHLKNQAVLVIEELGGDIVQAIERAIRRLDQTVPGKLLVR